MAPRMGGAAAWAPGAGYLAVIAVIVVAFCAVTARRSCGLRKACRTG